MLATTTNDILSAFLAIALPRSLPEGVEQPLNIAFPAELVTVLGISTLLAISHGGYLAVKAVDHSQAA